MLNIFTFDPSVTSPKVSDVGIADHYEFNANTEWKSVERYTIDALNNHILPYIGRPIYDTIAEKVNENTPLSTFETDLLHLLRRAVAYYAATIFIPLKVTNATSAGMMSNNSERVTPSSLGEIKFSLWQTTLQADKHLDNLLTFLEGHTELGEDSDDFELLNLWKNDPAYSLGTTSFFRRTHEFNRYYNIFNSRPTFLALAQHISDVSEDIITPIICGDMLKELTDQINGDTLSAENKTLLHYIRRAVAPLSVAKAAPMLALVTEASGFKVVSSTEGMDKRDAATKQHQAQIAALVARCQSEGTDKLNALRKFLIDNLDKYPKYAQSPCYRATLPRKKAYGINVITDAQNRGALIYKRR